MSVSSNQFDPDSGQQQPTVVKIQHLSSSQAVPTMAPHAAAPVVEDIQYGSGTHMPEIPATPVKKENVLVSYWRKAGGGSFMVSLAIHIVVLVTAYFVVETIITEEKVDFMPGGGSKSGESASQELSKQVQTKRRSTMQKSIPMQRVVSISSTAAITLPDVPLDSVAMPEMSSTMGGGSMGSGGFGTAGAGGGFGNGVGTGGMKGFMARTVFGNLGGTDGIPGTLYDFKQDRKGKPINYNANTYFNLVKKFTDGNFNPSFMRDYFEAPQKMSFTFLAVPLMQAEEGPKAFAVEKDVQPRGWLVHYSGNISPPESGDYRFVGYFDDLLAVYINGKPVLDASRDDLVNLGESKPDLEVRQAFGGMNVLNGKAYAGKWVRLSGPFKIDILVGERPGGQVGGLLMVENKKDRYKKRDNDTPILPLFVTSKPDKEDMERMKTFSDGLGAFGGVDTKNVPLFSTGGAKTGIFGGGSVRPGGTGLLTPR